MTGTGVILEYTVILKNLDGIYLSEMVYLFGALHRSLDDFNRHIDEECAKNEPQRGHFRVAETYCGSLKKLRRHEELS